MIVTIRASEDNSGMPHKIYHVIAGDRYYVVGIKPNSKKTTKDLKIHGTLSAMLTKEAPKEKLGGKRKRKRDEAEKNRALLKTQAYSRHTSFVNGFETTTSKREAITLNIDTKKAMQDKKLTFLIINDDTRAWVLECPNNCATFRAQSHTHSHRTISQIAGLSTSTKSTVNLPLLITEENQERLKPTIIFEHRTQASQSVTIKGIQARLNHEFETSLTEIEIAGNEIINPNIIANLVATTLPNINLVATTLLNIDKPTKEKTTKPAIKGNAPTLPSSTSTPAPRYPSVALTSDFFTEIEDRYEAHLQAQYEARKKVEEEVETIRNIIRFFAGDQEPSYKDGGDSSHKAK